MSQLFDTHFKFFDNFENDVLNKRNVTNAKNEKK